MTITACKITTRDNHLGSRSFCLIDIYLSPFLGFALCHFSLFFLSSLSSLIHTSPLHVYLFFYLITLHTPLDHSLTPTLSLSFDHTHSHSPSPPSTSPYQQQRVQINEFLSNIPDIVPGPTRHLLLWTHRRHLLLSLCLCLPQISRSRISLRYRHRHPHLLPHIDHSHLRPRPPSEIRPDSQCRYRGFLGRSRHSPLGPGLCRGHCQASQ